MLNPKDHIREVPDFPKPGVLFYDISPLLQKGLLNAALQQMYEQHCKVHEGDPDRYWVDLIGSPEARGFVLGATMSSLCRVGFIPFRKKGKLPHKTVSAVYSLEYGCDEVFMHEDAIQKGQRVLLVDDVLATGGTMAACCQLVEKMGGVVSGCCFLIELESLKGRGRLSQYPVSSLLKY
jgi:adenine phosphoribosyltransferase